MSKPTKLYKDTIHGITAEATNEKLAWAMIRAEVKLRNYQGNLNLQVPCQEQITEVTD